MENYRFTSVFFTSLLAQGSPEIKNDNADELPAVTESNHKTKPSNNNFKHHTLCGHHMQVETYNTTMADGCDCHY
jgi:hypothetical protein